MKPEPNIFFSTLQSLANWAAGSSLWPFSFGISCCAIQMMHAAASRIDLDRFGCLFRPSPRHSDLMIVAGSVTKKMSSQIITLYDQMLEPKYVIAMGICAISGGLFKESESIVNGVGKLIPVDIEIPGCPPSPKDLAEAILGLQRRIKNPIHLPATK
ncbi:hypothetical protein FACS1894113_5250 [Alphaproteobacteria bacterium]|nr:hypothetical protein FACS1894113_5250 [Alphaproteobacteria bacterium]